ncbi:MAG: XdhC family protein [Gammaproteobacteria bacterium]|jgi:xanthine dehydrogenase accessory factor
MVENDAVLERANELRAAGRPFVLVTVVRVESPTSAKPGAKAIIEPDGVIQGWVGGGCAQPAVIKTARQAIADGQARLIRISPEREAPVEPGVTDFGMTCFSGGTLDIFIDPIVPRPALLIVGASPAARALSALAAPLGFSVTVAFPGVDASQFPDAGRLVESLQPTALTDLRPGYVVVATQGKRDEAGLEAALGTGAPFIAFIASARKAAKLREYLTERGHDPSRVAAIESPAGVEIGAVTEEEIALSVLARLVQVRRSGIVEPVAAPNAEAAAPAPAESPAEALGESVDPVCGMTVDIATADYHSEYGGRAWYFCCGHCQHAFDKDPQRYVDALEATP